MIILIVTKKQGFTRTTEDTFSEKQHGGGVQIDPTPPTPQRFKG